MSDQNVFDRYLLALRKTPIDDKTEHTDRPALQNLLQAIADGVSSDLTVHHETKQKKIKGKVNGNGSNREKKGAPDFKVTKSGGLILGYVENKPIGENLDKVLKSEQIKKYKSLSQNIVLTDYLHFIWINKDGSSARRCATPPTSKIRNSGCARTAPPPSASCCKPTSPPRPRASARRSSLRWQQAVSLLTLSECSLFVLDQVN
jgi:hypothetical protein